MAEAVRRAYDWAASFRRDLDDPNILSGRRVYETANQGFNSSPIEGGLAEFTPAAREAFDALHQANEDAVMEVAEEGRNPEDNQWKSGVLDRLKRLADAFLATDPDPPPRDAEMAGGKNRRRKTRKGKSRKSRSRRARHSRRR
jgi:hypothetical protein